MVSLGREGGSGGGSASREHCCCLVVLAAAAAAAGSGWREHACARLTRARAREEDVEEGQEEDTSR